MHIYNVVNTIAMTYNKIDSIYRTAIGLKCSDGIVMCVEKVSSFFSLRKRLYVCMHVLIYEL